MEALFCLNKAYFYRRRMKAGKVRLKIIRSPVAEFQDLDRHRAGLGRQHPRNSQPVPSIIAFAAIDRKRTVEISTAFQPGEAGSSGPFHQAGGRYGFMLYSKFIPGTYLCSRKNFHAGIYSILGMWFRNFVMNATAVVNRSFSSGGGGRSRGGDRGDRAGDSRSGSSRGRCGGILGLSTGSGRFILTFLEILVPLPVITEEVAEFLGGIDPLVIIIAEGDDGRILIQHPDKNGAVAMPPAIMIDQLLPVRDQQHPPAQAIVPLAWFFKAVGCIGAVHYPLGEQLS